MNARPILAGQAALLAAGAALAVNDRIELVPGGVIGDKGEGERARKITKHLFESPVPTPR